MNITLIINGKTYSNDVEPRLLLIHYLRETLGLTGTHMGCETSLCGACTVELNGKAIKSCTMFAVQANGANITKVEGLASEGKLDPIQEGFWNAIRRRLRTRFVMDSKATSAGAPDISTLSTQ